MPTDRRLRDFEGTWRLERLITHADGATARFEGQAIFAPQDDDLRYTEDGTLSLANSPGLRAIRCYVWHPDLSVSFEDGRPFHTIPASGGSAVHVCPPDTYRVEYTFNAWPRWQAVWEVSGPKKLYHMMSLYAPAT